MQTFHLIGILTTLAAAFGLINYHLLRLPARLRGGISIALALSLPRAGERSLVLVATYAVVAFSILVQGSTLKYLVSWRTGRD